MTVTVCYILSTFTESKCRQHPIFNNKKNCAEIDVEAKLFDICEVSLSKLLGPVT